jgi:aryl-alcohol dehydrogenase-like predicted oxidoreductase
VEYVTLGSTGVKVSRVGLGTWQFSEAWGVTRYEDARAIVAKALELGINLFDTAMVYGRGMSEEFLGRALRELGAKRDEVVVATKIPGELLQPWDVFRAVDRSLRRLGLGHIDVLQVHWPPCWHNIPTCHYMRALERLVELGKVSYLGLSDYPVELVDAARSCLARHDIEVLQVRYNLVERWAEEEHLPYAEEAGMSLLAWSPLAKGAVLGKYSLEEAQSLQDVRGRDPLFHPDNYRQILGLAQRLREVADRYWKTPAQVALNWLITTSDAVIPIPGAKSPRQVEDNAGAAGWRLSYEDWRLLDEESRRLRITYVTW